MNFTPAQQAAIDTKDCTLLVAAGAGSGKTRVLTERIISRLSEEHTKTDITRFLIVTFTNAAAKELSERIRLALAAKCQEKPSAKLFKNLALLPQAKICTIDAFCFDFVKENFQKLGLPPKLRIAESTEFDVLLEDVIGTLIEEKMTNSKPDSFFFTVYDMFSGKKSDAPFSETIKALYKDILNLPAPRAYLENACMWYKEAAEKEPFFDSRYGRILKDLAENTIAGAMSALENCLTQSELDAETYQKFEPLFTEDLETLSEILISLSDSYQKTCDYCSTLKFGSCRYHKLEYPRAPVIYEQRKKALDAVKTLVKTYFTTPEALVRCCAADCEHILTEIKDMLMYVDESMWEIKKQHGILSFADIERLTLELLYDDILAEKTSELATALSDMFDELYIDEYQDINPVQDMIFRALARKADTGEECSRFLVGDAKQSIYGFRGARPDIFIGYRDRFCDIDTTGAYRKRLFMSNNFRCSEKVIDFTNGLFSLVMEDYGESEKLVYSRAEACKVNTPVKVLLSNTDALENHTAPDRMNAEADMLYQEIKHLLADPNARRSDGKPYTLGDMAILTGKWDAAKILEQYFSKRGVPVICEKGESFFDRYEIRLAVNILYAVDNPERDIPLAGVLRSPVGGFSDDELVSIRLHADKKASLFAALSQCASSNTPNEKEKANREELSHKAKDFLERLGELRKLSRSRSVSEFLRLMYAKTDLINLCTTSEDKVFGNLLAAARRKNLLLLYDKARDFDKTVFKGVSAFLEYIKTLADNGDMKSCTDSVTEAVRIMTVHKSKGLEFPVCFLFGTDRPKTAPHSKYILHENMGIAFKLSGYRNIRSVGGENGFVSADTPFRALLRQKNDKEELLEYKRLLYVAITRAKDRLYITASPDRLQKRLGVCAVTEPQDLVKEATTFFDFVLAYAAAFPQMEILAEQCGDACRIPFTAAGKNEPVFEMQVVPSREERQMLPEEQISIDVKEANTIDTALLQRLHTSIETRNAKNQSLVSVPPKLTVSLLKQGLLDYEDAALYAVAERKLLETPAFVTDKAELDAAEKGTAMHVFMQFAEFAKCENDGCQVEAERLVEEGFIQQKQKEALDFTRLNRFFETALYTQIKNAKHVYRELRFNLKVRADEVLADVPETDDFVLIQGVIDCFVENPDGSFTVIDFKTDRVRAETGINDLINRYRNQLSLYTRAVREITECDTCNAVIFSFQLMQSIEVNI